MNLLREIDAPMSLSLALSQISIQEFNGEYLVISVSVDIHVVEFSILNSELVSTLCAFRAFLRYLIY